MAINRNPVYDDDYVTLGYLKEQIDESSKETRKAYSRNFGTQPTPPYYVNDTWTDDEGKLYVCIKERLIGKFDILDWTLIIDKKPYDDLVAEYGDITVDMLASQVYDHKLESFVQATDPSDEWETYIDREQHVYDFWRNTTDGKEYVYVRKDTNPITYEWELRAGSSIIWNTATGHKNMFNQKPETYDQYDLWYVDDSTSPEDIPDGININTWVMADKANTEYDKTDWSEAIIDIDLFITETKVYSKVEVDRRVNILENTFNTKLVKTENSIMGQVSSTYATQEVVTSLDSELGLMEDRMTTTEKNVNTLELTSDRTISSISSITNKVSGSATYDITTDTVFTEGTDYYIIDEDHYVMLAPGVDYVVGSNIADYDGDVYNATFTGGLEDDLVSTNQKVSTLEQTSEGFEASIASLQSGLGTTNQKVTTLEATTDGITAQISNMNTKIDGVSADFEDFKDNEYIQSINNLQDQIDGAIQFWNGPEIPTINNYPANQWTTEADKNNHRADIYTVIEDIDGELKQGKGYRFDKVGNTWQWIELTDNELSAVQAIAQEALDKSNKNGEDITQLEKKDLEIEANINGLDVRLTTLRNDYDYELTTSQTVTGNPITIEDAGAYPCENFIVEGKSEQETRSGKNKLNLDSLTDRDINGATLTKNNDGSFTLNGTTTNSLGFNVAVNTNDILKANTTYTIKVITKGTASSTANSQIAIREEENTNLANTNFSGASRTYTPTVDTNINYIRIYIDTGVTFTNFKVYPFLYEGTRNEEYEQYGVSPSPDYPSEIETVKGIENLFDGLVEAGGFNDATGATSSSTTRLKNSNMIKVEPNTPYVFSLDAKATTELVRYFFYDKTNNYLGSTSNSTGKFTTPENCYYINFHSTSLRTNYGFELPQPMITKENELYTYIPFGKYLISKITGKNLFDYITRFKPSVNGLTNTINPDGSITITGILTSAYTGIVSRTNLNPILINGETYKMFQQSNDNNNVFLEVRGISKTGGATKYFQKNGSFTVDLDNYDYDIGLLTKQLTDWGTEERTITGFYGLVRGSISSEFEPYKENIITYDLKKENLFDKNTITSGQRFGTDGNVAVDNSTFISEYIKVKPNTTYTVNYAIDYASRIVSYDKDYNKISLNSSLSNFTTNSNTEYIRLSGLLTNKDLMKLYEGTGTDDYYELASIGDIKDELDEASGVLTKRIGKYTFDGTEAWFKSGGTTSTMFAGALDFSKLFQTKDYIGLSNRFIYHSGDFPIGTFRLYNAMANGLIQHIALGIDITLTPDLATFKTWLSNNPVTVYYVLAEPKTIQLEPTEIELFKGTNNIYTLDDLEPNMNITYLTDSKLNSQYATKSELKVAEGNIKSEINATLENEYTTIEQTNAIEQKITDTENSIMLKVNQKANTTDVNNAINELTETTEASLELKLDKTDNNQVVSMINASADEVHIDGKKIALANFEITDEKLTSEIRPEYDFVQQDFENIRAHLMGEITLTPEQFEKYDIDKNGEIDILDWLRVKKMVDSGISHSNPGRFEIDTTPDEPEIIKFYNGNNELLYYISYDISKFNIVNCDTIVADSISANNISGGNIKSGSCILNSTNITLVEFEWAFETPPFVVITPCTSTTGVIAPKTTEVTTTGFKATIGGSGIPNVVCHWIAIG